MLLVKLTMQCFLFITVFGNILSLPFLPRDLDIASSSRGALFHRVRRQGPIVQPSWMLNSEEGLFEDFNVRVTDKKLEETEAIRDYIQGTVDNGTYAVELDEGDFEEDEKQEDADEEIPAEDLSQPGPELKPTTAPQPNPRPPSGPERKPTPKENPNNSPQPSVTTKPTRFFHKFKIAPKIYSTFAGRPFFTWLKKSSTA